VLSITPVWVGCSTNGARKQRLFSASAPRVEQLGKKGIILVAKFLAYALGSALVSTVRPNLTDRRCI
jgi:hypothetical protein